LALTSINSTIKKRPIKGYPQGGKLLTPDAYLDA
jgi:hypothetical protein